jgi:hypothetical protein
MSSVHCGIDPPAAVRLLKSEGRHFSEFTVFGYYYYYYLFEFSSYNGWGYLPMNVCLYSTSADRAGNRVSIPWEGQTIFLLCSVHNEYPQG